MNSMEFNKIVAAVLTAGVIAMLLGLFAKLVIPEHSAHGDHHGPNLFADLSPAAPVANEGPTIEPIAPFLAAATVEDGMKVARKCSSCHTFEAGGPNKVGPNLANLVGAGKASKDFAYSGALQEMDGEWSYENLNAFLFKPKDYVPGTKMSFNGLKDVEDRAAVIVYMVSVTDNPPAFPEPAAATEEAPTADGTEEPAKE
jgi:cytochrome c